MNGPRTLQNPIVLALLALVALATASTALPSHDHQEHHAFCVLKMVEAGPQGTHVLAPMASEGTTGHETLSTTRAAAEPTAEATFVLAAHGSVGNASVDLSRTFQTKFHLSATWTPTVPVAGPFDGDLVLRVDLQARGHTVASQERTFDLADGLTPGPVTIDDWVSSAFQPVKVGHVPLHQLGIAYSIRLDEPGSPGTAVAYLGFKDASFVVPVACDGAESPAAPKSDPMSHHAHDHHGDTLPTVENPEEQPPAAPGEKEGSDASAQVVDGSPAGAWLPAVVTASLGLAGATYFRPRP